MSKNKNIWQPVYDFKWAVTTPLRNPYNKKPLPDTTESLFRFINKLIMNHSFSSKENSDPNKQKEIIISATIGMMNYMIQHHGKITNEVVKDVADEIYTQVNNISGPFLIIKCSDILYPDRNLHAQLNYQIDQWLPHIKEKAKEKLHELENHRISGMYYKRSNNDEYKRHLEKLANLELECSDKHEV